MKLTRAIPALLALSLLTGCDVNAFMPKNGQNKDTIQNPTTSTTNTLTQGELKSVAAFQGGLVDAAGQGLTAAGTVNTLKSVAALKSVNAYRISALTWPDGVQWEEDQTIEGQFAGRKGTSETPKGWYMDGDFTLMTDLTAAGSASIITNGATMSFDTLDAFAATASVELNVKTVPQDKGDEIKALANSAIALTLTKPLGEARSDLSGDFTITKDGKTTEGKLEVELLSDTWTVTIPSKDDQENDVFIRLVKEPSGGGAARVYASKMEGGETVIDDDKLIATFSWGSNGKVKLNGKTTPITMPF